MTIYLDKIPVGPDHPPFIIAEMSGNHNHDLDRALKIVDLAASAGAHALKLQTYKASTMTIEADQKEFFISDKDNLWEGNSLYKLYDKAHTPWEWHRPIMEHARKKGMLCFSTPFDDTAVDFLEELGNPFYKIASFENIDIPLIKKVAQTKKPMIISTGMATVAELDETVRVARENGCQDIILLKCTSNYPASPKESNLLTIPHMRNLFQTEVGLSDHTLGIGIPLASIALGATVIEKHFTIERNDEGIDSAFSLDPKEMKNLVEESHRVWEAKGKISYEPQTDEKKSLVFRRSLYITEDVKKGDELTSKNLRRIRPGLGLAPKYYEKVLGKAVNQDIKKGTALSWSHLS